MTAALVEFLKALGMSGQDFPDFKPVMVYDEHMDWLFVIMEDVGYVSAPLIPGSVDVFWHPDEKRLVGLRVHGISAYTRGAEIIASLKNTS